jgi:hypothetical protein
VALPRLAEPATARGVCSAQAKRPTRRAEGAVASREREARDRVAVTCGDDNG